MKSLKLLAAVFCAAIAMPTPGWSQEAAKPQPKCETGPVSRSYGDTPWLVYSCDDNQSLVIATAAENPAAPFYFTFYVQEGHYHLHGEGTGSKAESAAAFKEIQKLSQQDINGLIAATKAQNTAVTPK